MVKRVWQSRGVPFMVARSNREDEFLEERTLGTLELSSHSSLPSLQCVGSPQVLKMPSKWLAYCPETQHLASFLMTLISSVATCLGPNFIWPFLNKLQFHLTFPLWFLLTVLTVNSVLNLAHNNHERSNSRQPWNFLSDQLVCQV